jgi:hypothetical protein
MQNAWREITMGADIRLPRVFYFIIQWVAPAALLVILGFWFYEQALPTFFMKDVRKRSSAADRGGEDRGS